MPDSTDALALTETVLELLRGATTILDVGCTRSDLDRALLAAGKRVTAVWGPGDVPADHFTDAVTVDLDFEELTDAIPERFDAVIFGDVLERLHDPSRVLEAASACLSDDGTLVAIVRNASVGMLEMQTGERLRFFDRELIEQLLFASGYDIRHVSTIAGNGQADAFVVSAHPFPERTYRKALQQALADALKRAAAATASSERLRKTLAATEQRLKESEELRSRAMTETTSVRAQLQGHIDTVDRLTRTQSEIEQRFAALSEHIDVLQSERVELEQYCRRMERAQSQARLRALSADYETHQTLFGTRHRIGLLVEALSSAEAELRLVRPPRKLRVGFGLRHAVRRALRKVSSR